MTIRTKHTIKVVSYRSKNLDLSLIRTAGDAPGYGSSQQQQQPQQYQPQQYQPQQYQPQQYQPQPQQPRYEPQQYQQPQQQYQQPQQQFQQPQQQSPVEGSESGNYQGLSYTIKHRNTSSILNVRLNQGDQIKSLPGAMVHMSPTVQLQGKINVSLKKLFTGAQLDESTYTGPGTVALAPILMGDIITLQVQPGKSWQVGRRWYLARTVGVEMDTRAQRFGQALFSGDGLFNYHMTGSGLLWLYAYGALDTLHVSPTNPAVNKRFVVSVLSP